MDLRPSSDGLDESVGVAVDGDVEDGAAELVAIGAEIGAAAGQAQPQAARGRGSTGVRGVMPEMLQEVSSR